MRPAERSDGGISSGLLVAAHAAHEPPKATQSPLIVRAFLKNQFPRGVLSRAGIGAHAD